MSSHLSKTDTHLYNVPRPKRNKKISTSSSSSLNFTSTLSSLISSTSTTESRGRPRPSHNKADIFTSHNKGLKKRAAKDLEDQDDGAGRKKGDQFGDVDDAVLARSQKKLQEKAKEYNELRRSSHIPEGHKSHDLVEWDRKWAENKDEKDDKSSGSELDEINPDSKEIIEFEDELGRTRMGTRAQKERMERKIRNKLLGQEELDRMSARPKMREEDVMWGPMIQTQATTVDEDTERKMEELARKRDRSATPPPASHYDASKEIRSKGVGFYAFSKDEELREQEMRDLESNRAETERLRKEREEKKNKRKREVEDRKELIARKKAQKMADKFLVEMGNEIPAPKAKVEDAVQEEG